MVRTLPTKPAKSQMALAPPQPAALLRWYDRYRRVLPWRALPGQRPDPYAVWISEIMLQQTTVAAVIPYYQKFMALWPTLKALAQAPLEAVLSQWAGLGYYRRARLLHQCAAVLVSNHDGKLPATEADLRQLPGFGAYTAAAVAAIAFDQPANVVDGNVERVMARIFAVTQPLPLAKTKLRDLAASLLPTSRHGDYAQALMDLGATVCTPRNQQCLLCPWQSACQALQQNMQQDLPRRTAKAIKPQRRALAFVLRNAKGQIYLRQRPEAGLLGGMLEVPSSPWHETALDLAAALAAAPVTTDWTVLPGNVRHIFTHFELEMTVAVGKTSRKLKPGQWADPHGLDGLALPNVMKKIIRHTLPPL
jgi:A/G-specific adenine glycosylase